MKFFVDFNRLKKQSFLSSLSPIVLLCEFVGVRPIYTTITGSRLITKTSIPRSLHTLFLLILQIILPFILTYEEKKPDSSINVLIFEEIVDKYLYAILGCICIVFTFLRRAKIMEFCRYIFVIDRNLKFLVKAVDYDGKRRQIFFHTVLGLIFYICLIINAYLTQENPTELIKAILSASIFAILGDFTACVSLVQQRYKTINDYVRNFSSNRIKFNVGTVLTPMDELKLTSRICGQLCEAAEIINEAYTFQLAYFVVLVFLVTLFGMFSTVRVMMMDAETAKEFTLGVVVLKNCCMSAFMIWMLVLIIAVCSSTQTEVSKKKIQCNYSNSSIFD